MCWKYENKYDNCFDLFFKDTFWQDKNGLDKLLRDWNIEVIEEKHMEYEKLFFEFLTKCEENGYFKYISEERKLKDIEEQLKDK